MADATELRTVTSTGPGIPAGVVTTRVVAFLETMVAGSSPNETEEVDVRFVPTMVVRVPPAAGPLAGVMLVIVGDPATKVEKLMGTPV